MQQGTPDDWHKTMSAKDICAAANIILSPNSFTRKAAAVEALNASVAQTAASVSVPETSVEQAASVPEASVAQADDS